MSVLAGYARTPFVKFNGVFAALPAHALGAVAVRSALQRSGVRPEDVDAVVVGQVLQAAAGQNPARQTAIAAGLASTVPAVTVNAVCLSGSEAVIAAHRLVNTGEAQVVVAVGQESMSQAPHAWRGSRHGRAFGAVELIDTLEFDGLTDAFDRTAMGLGTDLVNDDLGVDREAQDAWAARSHQALARAVAADAFADEIVPVEVPGRRGATLVRADDGLRADTTTATLSRLRPAFRPGGTVTAGNASQISDGAAAVVVVSEEFAARQGLPGLADVVSHATVAGPGTSLHAQPARAISRALERHGSSPADLRAVEINEAFAAVVVHSTDELGIDPRLVNPNGGAIALGHPIGASGTRITGHLAVRLVRAGGQGLGAAGICGGGGQGSAVVLRRRQSVSGPRQ